MSEKPHYCVHCGAAVTTKAELLEGVPLIGAIIVFVFSSELLPQAFPAFFWAIDPNLRFAILLLSVFAGFLAWFVLRDVRMKFRLRYGYTVHQIKH
jgi:hypothetical protein